jgi:chaperonin GroEL
VFKFQFLVFLSFFGCVNLCLLKFGKEVLGHASKVVLTKDTTMSVGGGSTQEAVNNRVAQIN